MPGGSAALPSAAAPASAGGQEGQTQTYSGWDLKSRFTIEASGGFNAPVGDKNAPNPFNSSGADINSVTWGGQFTFGSGFNINQHLAALIEYQFMDDKLPGAIIAEAGAQGGHDHIWSFTVDPVLDAFPKASNDLYVTGGGGFYRKVTSFTDPEEEEECYYFCGIGVANVTVGHFSSNQGGWNIGGGYEHRFGGMYGESRTRVFVEARYVEVLTPAVVGATPNGLSATTIGADTKLLPISLGFRW